MILGKLGSGGATLPFFNLSAGSGGWLSLGALINRVVVGLYINGQVENFGIRDNKLGFKPFEFASRNYALFLQKHNASTWAMQVVAVNTPTVKVSLFAAPYARQSPTHKVVSQRVHGVDVSTLFYTNATTTAALSMFGHQGEQASVRTAVEYGEQAVYLEAEVPSLTMYIHVGATEQVWLNWLAADVFVAQSHADGLYGEFNYAALHQVGFGISQALATATASVVPMGVHLPKQGRADFVLDVMQSWRNPAVSGDLGVIEGRVTIENRHYVSRKVRLYEVLSGLLVAETWSDDKGYYRFGNLTAGRQYFAVAHDYMQVYNAVVQDRIVADALI